MLGSSILPTEVFRGSYRHFAPYPGQLAAMPAVASDSATADVHCQGSDKCWYRVITVLRSS